LTCRIWPIFSTTATNSNGKHAVFWVSFTISIQIMMYVFLANYYSRRKLHDKSIDFLKRAIRIRPDDAQVWILLGHEYLQTKNQQGAILAYRRATCKFNYLCIHSISYSFIYYVKLSIHEAIKRGTVWDNCMKF
jgi:tetratricopeptide (TPR) repeat protein